MVFSSLTFLYAFLPLTLLLYYIFPKRGKNLVLMLTGMLFYAWGEPVYVLLMMLTVTVDYTAGRLIYKFDDRRVLRTVIMVAAVAINLSLLGVFKYSDFAVNNINGIFGTSIPLPGLELPIGISFYTFQSMSYTLDVYMRNIGVQKNYISYAAYVSLFPQIVAGPIVRYEDIQNEMDNRQITLEMIGDGVGTFIAGLAKKVLLANNIGALWTAVKATPVEELSFASAWLGILAFTFQIYYDFSGYSDMAIGLGKMLGFHFPENFDHPYMSRSVTEFWRRWHMTLGSWFRNYVYIPLGGNRVSTPAHIRNLLVVWGLTGLWHGASWNFVLWGLYFGLLLILEKFLLKDFLKKLPSLFSWAYTFLIVVLGWVLFEFDTVEGFTGYFKALFAPGGGFVDDQAMFYIASYILVFLFCIFFSADWGKKWVSALRMRFPRVMEFATPAVQVVFLLICTAYLVDATYNPFLYFRF
ncbi:MAG: MBOAT family protein [Ruminococcaceae bacterium]|nr:MBOAT family protein [Oscillospiraceae bacterium]